MTMSLPKIKAPEPDGHEEEARLIDRIRKRERARRLRAAQSLAARLQIAPDGSLTFIRFSRLECLEHQILIFTFIFLGLTGLLQRYSRLALVGWLINVAFGGVETLRTIHHLAALVFIVEALYHFGNILSVWFVRRERGAMWPRVRDFKDLVQMVRFNLGRADARPEFDRFSAEEKLEYWALLWGTVVMILTGLLQWFPILTTTILPGDAIPVARAIHGWEAVLAVLSILTWHLYHTVIKEHNRSIFSGTMTEKEMQNQHPLEYRRILTAYQYLQRVSGEEGRVNSAGRRSTDEDVKYAVAETGREN